LTTDKYYEWSSVKVGYIWLITTVVSVPTSLSVAFLSNYISDKAILLMSSIFYFVTLILKINFSYDEPMNEYYYMTGSTLFFLATVTSESITVSILSKVISKKKAVGFCNAGLMSGLADTFGRAVGSSLNTAWAKISSIKAVPC